MKPAIKRLLATLLALTLTLGVSLIPALAEGSSSFSDIQDPEVGEAAEILRVMGVVQGVGGNRFVPDGTLTRAEFCTMAIKLMGKEAEAAAQETRTIFADVTSTHWARGFINLAAVTEVGGSRLMLGTGDGKFSPDSPMTWAGALTFAMRVLGYGAEANVNWPYGAVSKAPSLGLDAGIADLGANDPMTRGQAALLFRNILLAKSKDSTSQYVSTLGTVTEGVIYMSSSAVAEDGEAGVMFAMLSPHEGAPAIEVIKPAHTAPGAFLEGRRGMIVTDTAGRLIAFIPETGVASRTVIVDRTTPAAIIGSQGERITVPSATVLLRDGIETTYGEAFGGINIPGLVLTVYYKASGDVDFIYVRSSVAVSGKTMVAAESSPNAFDEITGGSRTCTVIRNGVASSLSQIQEYDVGQYNALSDTLYVSDFRLSCYFASSEPNPLAPVRVTLRKDEELRQTYEVSECAVEFMGDVKEGDFVTALFAPDGKVAALLPISSGIGANAIGITSYDSTQSDFRIQLIGAPSGVGDVTAILSPTFTAGRMLGQVVSVDIRWEKHGSEYYEVMYPTVIDSADTGDIDLEARTVGDTAIAGSALIFERVGSGQMAQISISDIAVPTLPAEKVTFVHKNGAGQADILILDDVTGDRYVYGLVSTEYTATDDLGGDPVYNYATTVVNGSEQVSVVGTFSFGAEFGGIAPSTLKQSGVYYDSASYARLTRVRNVQPTAFSLSRLTFTDSGFTIPIADNVQCYNRVSGRWFSSLSECLLYSTKYTVYYDRTPEDGGKVRIIVAE